MFYVASKNASLRDVTVTGGGLKNEDLYMFVLAIEGNLRDEGWRNDLVQLQKKIKYIVLDWSMIFGMKVMGCPRILDPPIVKL